MSTKTIYIASPITLYDTAVYTGIEKLVKHLYLEDTVLFAKGMYLLRTRLHALWRACKWKTNIAVIGRKFCRF